MRRLPWTRRLHAISRFGVPPWNPDTQSGKVVYWDSKLPFAMRQGDNLTQSNPGDSVAYNGPLAMIGIT